MEVRAVAKFIRVQPRKVRLVAKEVKGKNAIQAANLLRFHPSKGAFVLRKVLVSAIHNASENHDLDAGTLKIREIRVDEGPVLKRIQPRAMGRANRIFKRMSHITVVVEDAETSEVVKAHGTVAKPRPSLAAKGKKKGKAASAQSAEPQATVTEEVVEDVTEEVTEPATQEATGGPEEATPVTASEAPEEEDSASPENSDESAEEEKN